MKKIINIIAVFFLILQYGCEEKDNLNYDNLKPIIIGDYQFEFPSNFEFIEKQGIDSYVGEVTGSGITLTFDFGYYAGGPNGYIPENTYDIIEDIVDGHMRQIFIAKDPDLNGTGVNFYDLNGYSEFFNTFKALVMGTHEISFEEQELVVNILKSGIPIK